MYLTCNIPVLLSAIRFVIQLVTTFHVDIFSGPTVFLEHYIWPLTYVVLVQTNALLNPLVYFVRMSWFRAGVRALFVRRGLMSAAVGPAESGAETSRDRTTCERTRGSECRVVVNSVRGGNIAETGGV